MYQEELEFSSPAILHLVLCNSHIQYVRNLAVKEKTHGILGYLHTAYLISSFLFLQLEVDSFGQSTFAEMNALLVSCGWTPDRSSMALKRSHRWLWSLKRESALRHPALGSLFRFSFSKSADLHKAAQWSREAGHNPHLFA
jgi:hypothetical protein